MTLFANITMNNGATPVVAQTFSVKKQGDGSDANSSIAWWENRALGVAVGFPRISQMMRFPGTAKGSSKSTKVTVKIAVPVMEVVSNSTMSGIAPAPTVAYTCLATLDVTLPERSSEAVRRDLMAYLAAYVATLEFRNAVNILEPVV